MRNCDWSAVWGVSGLTTVGSVLPDQGVEGVLHGPGLNQRLPAALHGGRGRVVEQAGEVVRGRGRVPAPALALAPASSLSPDE